MNNKSKFNITMAIIALGLLVVLAGCNIPGVATKTNEQYVQEAMQTLQAKSTESFFATAIAQMTEVAKPATAIGPSATVIVTPTLATQATQPPLVITVVATPTTNPVVPTVVILPLPTSTPKPVPCYRAQFITDITVPDGTKYAPGTAFTKVWRLKNTGTCEWDTSFDIAYESGELMGAPKWGR